MSTQFPIAPVAIRKALEPPAGRALLDALLNPAVDLLERRHCICDIETEWRISPSGTGRTIREYESIIRRASFRQFAEWFRAGEGVSLAADHPFADLPQYADDEVSLYADYKHFNELFENHSSDSTSGSYIGYDASKRVFLGVKDRKQDIITWADILKKGNIDEFVPLDAIPTLWLSSQKAHSPLHYDTYGKNIVVQLVGRKRWLLWPAGSPSLAPLRIPYEESSVYSEFDPMEFISGYKTFEEGADALRAAHPGLVEVVLEEGDALLVPPHVWHFVETCSPLALSVNLWISNDPVDTRERVKEAATRYVFGAMKSSLDQCGFATSDVYSGWANPSEAQRDAISGDEAEMDVEKDEVSQNNNVNSLFIALQQLLKRAKPELNDDEIDCVLQDNSDTIAKILVSTVLQPDVMQRFVNKVESELLQKLN